MKKILTLVFVAIAFGGVIVAILNNASDSSNSASVSVDEKTTDQAIIAVQDHLVQVTYFTTDVRCPSCLKIEELTKQTVQNRFARELDAGSVVFQLINVDVPENKHYIEDYELVSKTVIVSEFDKDQQGQWVNLQDVWTKLNDPDDFENYVAEAITSLL